MARPLDTSRDARARQIDAYRAMTPEHRLQLPDEMSTEVRSLARSGIRARLPDASDEEVDAELRRILVGTAAAAGGPELARRR